MWYRDAYYFRGSDTRSNWKILCQCLFSWRIKYDPANILYILLSPVLLRFKNDYLSGCHPSPRHFRWSLIICPVKRPREKRVLRGRQCWIQGWVVLPPSAWKKNNGKGRRVHANVTNAGRKKWVIRLSSAISNDVAKMRWNYVCTLYEKQKAVDGTSIFLYSKKIIRVMIFR